MLPLAYAADARTAERTIRDVVALSTLPAVWLGAEPLRIVESLAAALYTVLGADLVYVCLQGDAEHGAIAVAQTGRNETNGELAAALGPALFESARHRDPDDLLSIPNPGGPGALRVTTRPLALDAEYGLIAAGFLDEAAPHAVHHLLLNVAATQATTAIENVRLLRTLRRHAAQLTGLAEATGAMLNPSQTLDEALDGITRRAREVVGAHLAVIRLASDLRGGRAVTAVSVSDTDGGAAPATAALDAASIDAFVSRENRVVRLTTRQLETHPVWHTMAAAGPGRPLRGCLAAPLVSRHGANLGLIRLSDKYAGEFTEQDETILIQLARLAALVIEQRAAVKEAEAARAEAELASRTKDEFLAMLGHELRNPLAPIQTALQLMRLRGDGAADRERVVIERQVKHLTRLVDDLLDVSRIARGKVELRRERLDVAEVVAKAIEMASPLIEQRRHTLDVDVPRHGLAVDGDPMRLAQVISNLLTNAAKYTEPGGVVTVRAERVRDQVVVIVRDTGIGIAPEMLPRVFELFVQGRQSLDRSEGGLGLGLTIVNTFVAMHGGTVSAHSEGIGRGSEFVIRLPAASGAGSSETMHGPSAAPQFAPAPSLARILVVDDNEDAALMLVEALTSQGYEVRAAHDGPSALNLAAAFRPSVALLDIGLPVMDGYELAGRLRQLPGVGDLHLIAVTGYGQDTDRQRSRAAGFHEHLVKPIDLDALDRVVQQATAAQQADAG